MTVSTRSQCSCGTHGTRPHDFVGYASWVGSTGAFAVSTGAEPGSGTR